MPDIACLRIVLSHLIPACPPFYFRSHASIMPSLPFTCPNSSSITSLPASATGWAGAMRCCWAPCIMLHACRAHIVCMCYHVIWACSVLWKCCFLSVHCANALQVLLLVSPTLPDGVGRVNSSFFPITHSLCPPHATCSAYLPSITLQCIPPLLCAPLPNPCPPAKLAGFLPPCFLRTLSSEAGRWSLYTTRETSSSSAGTGEDDLRLPPPQPTVCCQPEAQMPVTHSCIKLH